MRQLNRADSKDAEWFYLQGNIFMKLRRFEEAHTSYREAVRYEPNNNAYREGALNAAVAQKKANSVGEKLFGWMHKK